MGKNNKIEFDLTDPFNPQNRVKGLLYRNKSRIGCLRITHVNEVPCDQYIFSTPKILNLEKNINRVKFEKVKIYEKIDGTNILLFRYRDIKGEEFISFKTRLSPFLRPQPYGDFIELWKEILNRYRTEFAILFKSHYSFGFELFGSKLRILTDYKTELDVRLLYALDPANGRITEPESDQNWRFPKPEKTGEYFGDTPLSELFSKTSEKYQNKFLWGKPVEGAMFYFQNDSNTSLYKCKPPAVTERQKRYGELYSHGKFLSRSVNNTDIIAKELNHYISENWSKDLIEKHKRVIEIVTEDIINEVNFNRSNKVEEKSDGTENILNHMVLWKSIWGSHLWGMDSPASDKDCCVVYQLDTETLFLGTFDKTLMQPHLQGRRLKNSGMDEHWYELGRAVQLILKGSLTVLYGVMSPIVVQSKSTALTELQGIIKSNPSKVFYKVLLRDVRDSEKAMARAPSHEFYLKHLRIACRNLRFGITLFTENRYEFIPSHTEDPDDLHKLRIKLIDAYEKSKLPEKFDTKPFDEYILRWRKRGYEEDFSKRS